MNLDIQQMNDIVEDIDRVLNKIAQQLKPVSEPVTVLMMLYSLYHIIYSFGLYH